MTPCGKYQRTVYFFISHILCDAKNINENESLVLKANLLSFLSKIIICFLCHKKQFIIVQMTLMLQLEDYEFIEV